MHTSRIARWGLLFIALLSAIHVHALQQTDGDFVVQAIQIRGLRSLSRETVLHYLPVRIGDRFDLSQSNTLIKNLYATGFFEDIQLNRIGHDLSIVVVERPRINNFTATGLRLMTKEKLDALLREKRLVQGEIFDVTVLENLKAQLRHHYVSQGYYAVKIHSTMMEAHEGQVTVELQVTEGPVTRIANIRILGNQHFTEQQLLRVLPLSTRHFGSFLTNNDQYNEEKKEAALEVLRNFYLDQGYFHFQVNAAQLSLSPDYKTAYLVIQITEGAQYLLNEHRIMGLEQEVLTATGASSLLKTQVAKVYSKAAVRDTEQAIKERLGSQGYLFAMVNTLPVVNEKDKSVDLVTYVVPGKRIYVRQIAIKGNYKTQDEVFRRLLQQQESSLAVAKDLQESVLRLNRSEFLEGAATVEPVPVLAGPEDQVDLLFQVKENNHIAALLNASYDKNGLGGSVSVNQANVLGTGSTLAFNFNITRSYIVSTLSYHNPFYTLEGIQRGFEFYYITRNNHYAGLEDATHLAHYAMNSYGGKLRYSFPIDQQGDTLQLGMGLQRLELNLPDPAHRSEEVQKFVDQYGIYFNQAMLDVGWERNSLNRFWFPTRGIRQDVTAQLRLSIGKPSLHYYKLNYNGVAYLPISRLASEYQWIIQTRWGLGYGGGLAAGQCLPFFAHYYAGGLGSDWPVRGYQINSLGPRDSKGKVSGANALIYGSAAVILPKPLSTERVRTGVFIDVGNVYKSQALFQDALRATTGIAVDFLVPVVNVALSFSVAKAINPSANALLDMFQFNIGVNF